MGAAKIVKRARGKRNNYVGALNNRKTGKTRAFVIKALLDWTH